jgi:hypothetical protein
MVEKAFLGALSQQTMEKSASEHHVDMMAFFTKHEEHASSIVRFLGIMETTHQHSGQALLLYAIQEGNLIAISRLLSERLADVNAVDTKLRSPLIHSTLLPSAEITLELLQNGADVHFEDGEKRNALWYAVKSDNDQAIEHLVVHNAVMLDLSDDDDIDVNPLSIKPSQDDQRFHEVIPPHTSAPEMPALGLAILNSGDDPKPVAEDTPTHHSGAATGSKERSTGTTCNIEGPEEHSSSAETDDDENDSEDDDCGSSCSECFGSSDGSVLSSEANSSILPSVDHDILISRALEAETEAILERMMVEVSDLLGDSIDDKPLRAVSLGNGKNKSAPSGSGSPSTSSSRLDAGSSPSRGERGGFNKSTHARRRSSNGATNDDDEEDEDNNQDRQDANQLGSGYRSRRKIRRFACPYFVRYPEKYRDSRRTACSKVKGG